MLEKFKSLLSDDSLYISLLIIFVGVASFGLGRLSVTSAVGSTSESSGVNIIQPRDSSDSAEIAQNKPDFALVASKSGSRYHLLSCPGAGQIKEENKIFFTSTTEAEAAGFTPAANCQF